MNFRPLILFLIVGTSVFSGCTSDDTKVSETIFVAEDDWRAWSVECFNSCNLELSVELNSGPNVDVYVMTESNFDSYKNCDSFYYLEEFSMTDTNGFTASGTIENGDYVVVIDNTDCGVASPPSNGENNDAGITFTLEI